MTKRMLIDATHAEETRIVVLDGSRLEDFDVETATKRQLKGNIYLAKVVRVEPSLQAAFVEYGGNRHGFLAFSEIHPDYYQIPVADRQRLVAMEAEQARLEEEQADLEMALESANGGADAPDPDEQQADAQPAAWEFAPDEQPDEPGETAQSLAIATETLRGPEEPAVSETGSDEPAQGEPPLAEAAEALPGPEAPVATEASADEPVATDAADPSDAIATEAATAETVAAEPQADAAEPAQFEPAQFEPAQAEAAQAEPMAVMAEPEPAPVAAHDNVEPGEPAWHPETEPEVGLREVLPADPFDAPAPFIDSAEEPRSVDAEDEADDLDDEIEPEAPPPETVGGELDNGEERGERRMPSRYLRNYKIQEVIRRRQILLVQVVKEERGTKGAALTTYLSLAGRFSVLMPNSPRGGGISRKITSAADRRRLKEVMTELDIPQGMGLIVRTAGAQRPKPEIKRDCEYLLRLWDDIREHTMKSVAPALIYEEASLIKRAIRDVYSRDIDEILVDGEEGWRAAHDFMRMLMPTHAKKVQLWRDPQPLFARGQVEAQLDGMLQPIVQLRSGGYLVINQTEALVAIDVNSGRSTRERNIEETALRTNLEAADEVARQLRLRDLAGLIVIDLIDMESKRHNAMVERRIKDALKNDRARIQVGHISHFGLLEMSRQRLRPSLAEASFIACPNCGGTGHVRSTENAAIHVLRGIEEEGGKRRAAEIAVSVATPVALYLLNHKRDRLQEIEHRTNMRVIIAADNAQAGSDYRIERVRAQIPGESMPMVAPAGLLPVPATLAYEADDDDVAMLEDDDVEQAPVQEAPRAAAPDAPARAETAEEAAERGRRRRRRRRRGGRREDGTAMPPGDISAMGEMEDAEGGEPAGEEESTDAEPAMAATDGSAEDGSAEPVPASADDATDTPDAAEGDDETRARRRGRRGGRRKRRDGTDMETNVVSGLGAEQPELVPVYAGPTPADPFGGAAFDIFDVLEQAEQRAAAAHVSEPASAPDIVQANEPEPMLTEPVDLAPAEAAAELAPVEAMAEMAPPVHEPEVMPVLAAAPEAEIVNVAAPEAAPHLAPAPELAEAVSLAEPETGPIIQPIVIGAEPPAEKKRGWWRR